MLVNPKPTLADRLRDAGAGNSSYRALYALFSEDYFTGLGELTGLTDYFTSVYQSNFKFYDPDSSVPLAEMAEKAANFVTEKQVELLYLLFVQPYYYIAHMERS